MPVYAFAKVVEYQIVFVIMASCFHSSYFLLSFSSGNTYYPSNF